MHSPAKIEYFAAIQNKIVTRHPGKAEILFSGSYKISGLRFIVFGTVFSKRSRFSFQYFTKARKDGI